ncbi:MAG: hypothetical protein MUO43_11325 [Desulfobacterales bacterium]|nr:hypothetical protein [Desulfobacterales bacterium]
MKKITNGSLGDLLKAADTGPFMQAEIFSLTGKGKLRVTCNWLYSSLNCDPSDNSVFLWEFSKIDNQRISISPANSCISKRIYASIRDDIDWYVQVQAPYSGDWITAVKRDEIISFSLHDLSIAQFNGFNGSYITLNSNEDNHGGHSGYRIRSIGSTFSKETQWFIGIKLCLQSDIEFSGYSNSMESLQRQLTKCGINLESNVLDKINIQLNTF